MTFFVIFLFAMINTARPGSPWPYCRRDVPYPASLFLQYPHTTAWDIDLVKRAHDLAAEALLRSRVLHSTAVGQLGAWMWPRHGPMPDPVATTTMRRKRAEMRITPQAGILRTQRCVGGFLMQRRVQSPALDTDDGNSRGDIRRAGRVFWRRDGGEGMPLG